MLNVPAMAQAVARHAGEDAFHLAAAGALAGLAGGAAMALLAILLALTAGVSPWPPVEVAIAALLRSAPAMAVPLGLLLHAALSMLLGMLFAALFAQYQIEVLVPVGALYGLAVWLGVRYAIFPLAGAAPISTPALVSEHLAYGASLWLFLPILGALEKHRQRV